MALAAELKSKWVGTTSAAKSALTGEVGIYRRLKAEHAELLSLMEAAEGASDAAVRTELFGKIRQLFTVHAEAEEKEFYSVLTQFTETLECTQINVDEHRVLGAILTTLQNIEPLSAEWSELFGKFKMLFVGHIGREENELFEASKAFVTTQEAKDLETRFTDQKAVETTRLDQGELEFTRYEVPIR
jgi:hemerythrin superfamily protein